MTPPEIEVVTGADAALSAESWQQSNDAWLSAAVAHLRLTLAAMADGGPPSCLEKPSQDEIDAARQKREAAEQDMAPPPVLHVLGDRFALTPFERDVLLLCAAIELDTRVARLCAAAQGDAARDYPTFALALALFDKPAWDVMSPNRPLRYWRLIDIHQPGDRPLTASALRADERVVNFLKGLSYLNDRLSPLLVPFDAEAGSQLPPSQEAVVNQAVGHLRAADGGAAPLVQLLGANPISREMVAQRVAQTLNSTLFKMPASMLPRPAAELETLARLWHRESLLMPVALYLDTQDMGGGGETAEPPIARFISRLGGIFMIGAREGRGDLGPMVQAVHTARPTASEQAGIWSATLSDAEPALIARLSGQSDLDAPAPALWRACIETSALNLDRLAERIRPVARFEDIVLPPSETALLRQLAAQVSRRAQVYDAWGFRDWLNRGLGISALFAGDSGTGKTMAAEVVANALDLRLYRIDLSAVVSKYIGETEKNLRQLFDAAEGGGAILFFDEADALFGKRSEVRDSHDRYANIETSYLLQRIESFRGLAILSTNMRGALDDAFLRRLRFVINFPYPGPVQRRAIWTRAWPVSVPLGALDVDRLARLNLPGGNIATVALNAAFIAAETGRPVTMPIILTAARTEYEKLERPVNEAEFRWREPKPIQEATA